MHEGGAKFNQYQRDFETTSWRDLPAYVKEIALGQGSYQQHDTRTTLDHRWVDPETDDAIYVACHNFRDTTLCMIEINKGNEIGNIRKYSFLEDKQGIGVFDTQGNELVEEQQEQAYLEAYLNDRLRTSGVRDFEISHEGDDKFWSMAASQVVSDYDLDDTIRAAMCAPGEVKMEYRKYMADNLIDSQTSGFIPRRYLFQAIAERENQIISNNQLES